MTAASIIEWALVSGVMLSTDGQSIKLVTDTKPSGELLQSLTATKQQVIGELDRLQKKWLSRVAHTLNRPPEWMLKHGIITADDMQELWHTEPRRAAEVIKTGAKWRVATR